MKDLATRQAERLQRRRENHAEVKGEENMDGQASDENTDDAGVEKMNVAELKAYLDENSVEYASNAKKDDLLNAARNVKPSEPATGNGGGSAWNDPNA